MKEFTFRAPVKYLDITGTDLKTITTQYGGANTIWVQIDAKTQKVVTFAGEGTLPKPEDTEEYYYVLLDQDNDNQVSLMDMLSTCRAHVEGPIVDEVLHTFTFDDSTTFVLKYPRWTNENTLHTYEFKEVTVNPEGIVTYPWKKPHITVDQLKEAVDSQIAIAIEQVLKLQVPEILAKYKTNSVLTQQLALQKKYQHQLEVLEYIKDNMLDGSVGPWKLHLPGIEELQ
jgi:hypothetical protein